MVSSGPVPDPAAGSAADIAGAYVALCLRLRRLVPALVDAAAVDPALRRSVAAEPLPTAAGLVREAGRLAVALPDAGWATGPDDATCARYRPTVRDRRRSRGVPP